VVPVAKGVAVLKALLASMARANAPELDFIESRGRGCSWGAVLFGVSINGFELLPPMTDEVFSGVWIWLRQGKLVEGRVGAFCKGELVMGGVLGPLVSRSGGGGGEEEAPLRMFK